MCWEFAARLDFANRNGLVAPTTVLRGIWLDRHLYPANLTSTVREATEGWLVGVTVAVALASVTIHVRLLERVVQRVAVATAALPVIATGPILQIALSGDWPKASLAALSVFFTVLIGTLLGLSSANQRSIDLVTSLGGGSWVVLRKIRIRSALPAVFAALRVSVAAALLGAMIGEFLGTKAGLGGLLINAMATLDARRAWGVASIAAMFGIAGYLIFGELGRLVTPWARGADSEIGDL